MIVNRLLNTTICIIGKFGELITRKNGNGAMDEMAMGKGPRDMIVAKLLICVKTWVK